MLPIRKKYASFWIYHKLSNSKALVEFCLKNKKVALDNVYFIQGNVLDINIFRLCVYKANLLLNQ